MKVLGVTLCAIHVLVFASTACAHAFLDHASPPVGSKVQVSPDAVKLWFTQELELAFSTLSVQDASGTRVDKADVKVEGGGFVLRVSVQSLPPGRYKVVWRVLSVDTHVTEGDFTFEVAR